jgi:pimeloyl-ACP methyl ester carboxylesterase
VVLLHGFPEFWYAWRHQIPALAGVGYRVVAPDLPGYNTYDKRSRVRDYRPSALVQNVADLILALGADSAAVAGHDWGGALAWLLAMQHPERVERLVVLNAPHPSASSGACAAPASCGAAGTCSPSSSSGCLIGLAENGVAGCQNWRPDLEWRHRQRWAQPPSARASVAVGAERRWIEEPDEPPARTPPVVPSPLGMAAAAA